MKREPVMIGVTVAVVVLILAALQFGLSRDEILWAVGVGGLLTGVGIRSKVTPAE